MRVYRSKPVPAPLCVVYSVVPTVVQYSLDGSGRRRKGPKGKVPGARMPHIQRVKGKKAKHTEGAYVHPDYGRKIKRSGAPKDSPPCPRARRYGYQFEYKSSSRLIIDEVWRSKREIVCRSSKYAMILVPFSLILAEIRFGFMYSVLHVPKGSFLPYSTNVIYPALEIIQRLFPLKSNF